MADKTIAEVIAEGRLKRFMNPRLVKALGHALREHILSVLNERVASPAEIGRELGLKVEDFYHHVEVLEKLGLIERVATKRRRGATEHFFRAKACLHIDDSEWARVPLTVRADLSLDNVQSIFHDVVTAIQSGTFDARNDQQLGWLPGCLDERGLQEEVALLNAALACSMAIHKRSAERLAKRGERGTPWSTVMFGFEMPAVAESTKEAATR